MDAQSNTAPEEISLDDLHTIDEFAAKHRKILTKGTLQWQLRFRSENGLEKVCIKLGRRLLIHGPSYERWLSASRSCSSCALGGHVQNSSAALAQDPCTPPDPSAEHHRSIGAPE